MVAQWAEGWAIIIIIYLFYFFFLGGGPVYYLPSSEQMAGSLWAIKWVNVQTVLGGPVS